MAIQVINVDDPCAFNYMLYPEQHINTRQFVQQQLSGFNNSLTDVGRSFIETSRSIYDQFNNSNAIRMAKAVVRMAKGIFHPNTIYELNDLEVMRSCQPIMQRYMMAEPTIRKLYHQQRCDGYSDTYYDVQPKVVGVDHYDYRRVTDGMVNDDDDGWTCVNHYEDLRPDDKDLSIEEKVDILKSWELAEMFIKAGEDPTNVFGGKIG
jgi:hypothetical protein